MNRLLSILILSLIIISGYALQPYHDALLFDAKGNIECINYRSGSSMPTPAVTFSQDGTIQEIVQQQAFNDTLVFSTPMPIENIIRDDSGHPKLIKFKTQMPHEFSLNIVWDNSAATEFKYLLVYNTKFIKELDSDGLTTGLKLYAVLDDTDNWVYGGKTKFSEYTYDENGNWIKRTVTLFDENNIETTSYTEQRQISYY